MHPRRLPQTTGATLTDERKHALIDLLASRGVPLVEDDVYGELHFTPTPMRSRSFVTKADSSCIEGRSRNASRLGSGSAGWLAARQRQNG